MSSKGLISKLHNTINKDIGHDHMKYKLKWEKDLHAKYSDKEWEAFSQSLKTLLTNTRHRLIQFNIIHRIFYTPHELQQFYPTRSPNCLRCQSVKSDASHMFWEREKLDLCWGFIHEQLSDILQREVVTILGDLEMLHYLTMYQEN